MLDKRILEALDPKYSRFTSMQKAAFELILSGQTVVISSETGSGKTEAAILPVFQMILENPGPGVKAVYITPLRALNRDIHLRMARLAQRLNLRLDVRHGDTPQAARKKQNADPPDFLVTTPETFQALITSPQTLELLSNVRYIIIDEVNELIQSKRGVQLALALGRFRLATMRSPQLVFLSATVRSGRYVLMFFNTEGRIVYMPNAKPKQITVDIPKLKNNPREVLKLVNAHKNGKTIIFVNTRQMAEHLAKTSLETNVMHDTEVHHSSLSLAERLRVETEFKTALEKSVISTSSLQLGIDVGKVEKMIQIGSPRSVETLLQRLGRAGHSLEGSSSGLIIAFNAYDLLESVSVATLMRSGWLERPTLYQTPLDVLANQIVGHALLKRAVGLDEIRQIPKFCLAYQKFKEEDLTELLEYLRRAGALKYTAEGRITPGRRSKEYFYSNLSMIPSETRFKVKNIVTNGIVGYLDSAFVERGCEAGGSMVLGHRRWRIVSADYGSRTLQVKPTSEEIAIVPSWSGETIPVDKFVSHKMLDLLRSETRIRAARGVALTEAAKKGLQEIPRVNLSHDRIYLVSIHDGYFFVLASLGTRGNRGLGLLVNWISSQAGFEAATRVTALGVIVRSKMSVAQVAEHINSIQVDNLRRILEDQILEYGRFTERIFSIARRFGFDVDRITTKYGARRTHLMLCQTYIRKEIFNEVFSDLIDLKALEVSLKKPVVVTTDEKISDLVRQLVAEVDRDSQVESEESLIELVKNRIERKRFYCHCLSCFGYSSSVTVADVKEGFRCPKCGSAFLGFLTYSGDQVKQSLQALKTDTNPTDPEVKNTKNELVQSAEVYLAYGPKGLRVLAGFGIGPLTAKRILRKRLTNEYELFSEILKAEEQYIRTKEFWS